MEKQRISVYAFEGLHARPAHLFCAKSSEFVADIRVCNVSTQSDFVNAKSILMTLTLGVIQGQRMKIRCFDLYSPGVNLSLLLQPRGENSIYWL